MTAARSFGLLTLALTLVGCGTDVQRGGHLTNVIVEPRLEEKLAGDRERQVALGTLLGPYGRTGFGNSLTAADQRFAEVDALNSLETVLDGSTSNWTNPGTSHAGSFTPILTYTSEDGLTCRDYNLVVTIEGQSQDERGSACMTQDGSWWTIVVPIRSSTRRGLRR